MCDESSGADVALGEVGGAIEGLIGFVLSNAIPATCGLAVAATAVFILDHLLIIGIITGATLGVSTVAAIIGARHLLKHHTVIADPRGLTSRPARRIAARAKEATLSTPRSSELNSSLQRSRT